MSLQLLHLSSSSSSSNLDAFLDHHHCPAPALDSLASSNSTSLVPYPRKKAKVLCFSSSCNSLLPARATSHLHSLPLHVAAASALDQEIPSFSSPSGISYDLLKQRLQAGEWEAADEETRRLLCVLAGEAAANRKWVYFSEVKFIPVDDLQMLDKLWRSASNDKFGYSVQRRIWKSVRGNWTAFFKKVQWTRPLDDKNDTYRKFPVEFMWDAAETTPDGHLPLTNCLRGTQLLQEILEHPAFDEIESKEAVAMNVAATL